MTRRFPRSPQLDDDSPFQDAQGRNPFSDGQNPSAPNTDPFSSPSLDEVQPYRPAEYETTLPDRGGYLLKLAGAGAATALLAAVFAAVGVWYCDTWLEGLAYALPVALVALAISSASWMLAGGDLRAIRVKAMEASGSPAVRTAHLLGIAATFLAAGLMAGFLAAMIIDMFS